MTAKTMDGASANWAAVKAREAPRRRTWLSALLATDRDPGGLLLRGALAVVIFPHGAQKLLGWFGGFGLEGSLRFGQRTGEGIEFHILALALSLALLVRGGGAFSFDRWLDRRAA